MGQFKLYIHAALQFGAMIGITPGYEIRIAILCVEICIGLTEGAHGYYILGLTSDKAVKEGRDE